LFLIGDEAPYRQVKRKEVLRHIGDQLPEDIAVPELVAALQKVYDVYFVVPKMTSHWGSRAIHQRWVELLGQNVLRLEEPAGICELVAATIGIAEGKVDLDQMTDDLRGAGSSGSIVHAVGEALASEWGRR